MRIARAAGIALASLGYLAYVFRLLQPDFRSSGLGDWIDPYFINGLLEHWRAAALHLRDPASPPMFFPVAHTLGYSHGLVLYAPIYIVARLLLHPFQAYSVTLLAVVELGTLSVYAVGRRAGLGFLESALLAGALLTSRNALDNLAGVWSQRLSLFLIPPIVLLAVASRSWRRPAARRFGAGAAGLLAAALFIQDFYTALFGLFFAVCAEAAWLTRHGGAASRSVATLWRERRAAAWFGIACVAVAAATLLLHAAGGTIHVGELRLASRGWERSLLLAGLCAAGFLARGGGHGWTGGLGRAFGSAWPRWFWTGAAIGAAWFLWIYLPSFRTHESFPDADVAGQLGAAATTVSSVFVYDSAAPFILIAALCTVAWIRPGAARDPLRQYAAWALGVSMVVILMPARIGGFSLWMTVFRPLPGFAVIRDPKRVIYLYQLAVVGFAGFFLSRLDVRSAARTMATVLVAAALVAGYSGDRFDYARPGADFDRWVAAPIAVDPGCRSFYVARATPAYESRSMNLAALYGLDALFIATASSTPTLNGYSAWTPEGWAMGSPDSPGYVAGVRQWIAAHHLDGVCELDLERRRMAIP